MPEFLFPPERRAAAKVLCDAASAGPWLHDLDSDKPTGEIESEAGGGVCCIHPHGNVNTAARTGEWFSYVDARFITTARTDLPAALAELDRLDALIVAQSKRIAELEALASPVWERG